MEAVNQRFDMMEKRMKELEEENGDLRNEIASLKDELSVVKCQVNSFDGKLKTQQETTFISQRSVSDEEDSRNGTKSLKKTVRFCEKSGLPSASLTTENDDTRGTSLTELEQQLADLKPRLENLEFVDDIKTRGTFMARMTSSSPFGDQVIQLDTCIKSECYNPGGALNEDDCNFKLPVFGIYGLTFCFRIQDGVVDLYLESDSKTMYITSSEHCQEKTVLPLLLSPSSVYSFSAKRVSGNPTGNVLSLVCFIESMSFDESMSSD